MSLARDVTTVGGATLAPRVLAPLRGAGGAATGEFGEEVLSGMGAWLIGLALIGVIFAPAIGHLLAPGFRDQGERFPLAVEFVRVSIPYVAVSGTVAVAVAALNAAGRVAAAAFGLIVFNGVLVTVVFALIMSDAPATVGTAAILSAAMVVAGAAQLLCVGAAWLRLETRPRRPSLAPAPAVRPVFGPTNSGGLAGGHP